jgi:hypothetical protein
LVFDVTSGPAGWVAENSELVAKFLKITADGAKNPILKKVEIPKLLLEH